MVVTLLIKIYEFEGFLDLYVLLSQLLLRLQHFLYLLDAITLVVADHELKVCYVTLLNAVLLQLEQWVFYNVHGYLNHECSSLLPDTSAADFPFHYTDQVMANTESQSSTSILFANS